MFTTMESLPIIFSHQGSHWGTAHLLLKIIRDIKEAFFNEIKIRLQCDFVTLGLQKSYSERHAKGFCHCHAICMEFMSRSFGTNFEPEHYSTNRFTAALLPVPGNNRNIGFRVFVFKPKGRRESISVKSF